MKIRSLSHILTMGFEWRGFLTCACVASSLQQIAPVEFTHIHTNGTQVSMEGE